jgi:uracil-DNA glycosylase family 4
MLAAVHVDHRLHGPVYPHAEPSILNDAMRFEGKGSMRSGGLAGLDRRVARCRACPRLVRYREEVARTKRRAYQDETYWGRPVPAFGDPKAGLLIVGLAPAAHGANRTGRMFTGDRSGDFLYAALHRAGFANRETSTGPDDGLELEDCRITAVVHCAPPANRPATDERDRCVAFLVEEIETLAPLRAILCLGIFGFDGTLRALERAGHRIPRPRPRFAHGSVHRLGPGLPPILCCYHPSQQNTFTGRLTPAMLDGVLEKARTLLRTPRRKR